jgi:NAD(P)-dependent dehydrogenase (short-subunit alcohol dehydrogenase family)
VAGTIAISGVARGIGEGLARRLLAEGWRVVGFGRSRPSWWRDDDGRMAFFECDMANSASVQAACEAVQEPLHVLLCNAATFGNDAFHADDFRADAFVEALMVNTVAPALMARCLKPRLLQGERRLIVMMSTGNASLAGNRDGSMLAYRASKSALNQVVRTLAANWQPEGFTTLALNPGWVRTSMGGEHAPLSVDAAAAAIAGFLRDLAGPALNGGFVNTDGSALPW